MSDKHDFEDIKITRIITEEVGVPSNDGTEGSGLYAVPFEISAPAPSEWAQLFVHHWDRPSRYTTMHRPGIARVFSKKIILDGTTMDEVERYHRDTLLLALDEANRGYREWTARQADREAREATRVEQHREDVEQSAKRIKFD